jgi:hypothetical protein
VAECTLDVELPADQISRQDVDHLQQLREAVTSFDTLAAADNAAFMAALSAYTEDETQGAVWPEWRFSLGGFLSADDTVTKTPYVTWGELLFASPEDPWQHSPGFCDAMKRLQGVGIGSLGSHRNRVAWIKWNIRIDVMTILGKQQLMPTKCKCSPLSDELGKLMMTEAPPIVVVESARDSIALIKAWQAAPSARRAGIQAVVGKTSVSFAKYEASGIGQVAAGLAHAKMSTFELSLKAFADGDKAGQVLANAGFFFSVLCSGRTVWHLNGVADLPALERHKEIGCLDVVYGRAADLGIGGLFSAVADGKMIRRLQVRSEGSSGIYRDQLHWKWLAYAFWSRSSNACIPELNVGFINLTEEHLSAIEDVLKCSYPQPAEHPTPTLQSQYRFANILAGTELRPVGLRGGDDSVLVVSRDVRCRAHLKSSAVGNQLGVVVPGYGICTMPNVDGFESGFILRFPCYG